MLKQNNSSFSLAKKLEKISQTHIVLFPSSYICELGRVGGCIQEACCAMFPQDN